MKNKVVAVILALAMTCSLCACGSKDGDDNRERTRVSSVSIEETVESTVTAESTKEEDIVPTGIDNPIEMAEGFTYDIDGEAEFDFFKLATEDWQYTYREVLRTYREERGDVPHGLGNADADAVTAYFLADISGDDIPELFVKKGDCEAAYNIDIYTYENGETIYVDNIGAGHTSYYSVPGEKYIICWYGHMGYSNMSSLTMENGTLTGEEIFEEDLYGDAGDASYTTPDKIVDGATLLSEACYCLDMPLIAYKQPIITGTGLSDFEVETIINDMINNDGMVYPVYVYHFREEPTEQMSYSTFVSPGNEDEYGDETVYITDVILTDLNNDGQSEYLAGYSNDSITVFSIQNGVIYAYVADYVKYADIIGTGSRGFHIVNDYTDDWQNIIFDKEQAYYKY